LAIDFFTFANTSLIPLCASLRKREIHAVLQDFERSNRDFLCGILRFCELLQGRKSSFLEEATETFK